MGTSQFQTQPHGEIPELEHPAPARLARYLLLVLLIPLIFYPLPFFIAMSTNYEHWSTAQWGPMLEYAYDTTPKNADVVIFGDSSAFIGIDPKILNAKFGIHSLVLPDTIGSIPVTGDAPLRTYLRHNSPPKLLVLYFSAWNLDFSRIAKVRQFEGEEMMLRHESWPEIAHFALHHPTEVLQFPFRLYSTFGPKMISAALHHVNRERATAASLGHADYNDATYPPLKADCQIPQTYVAQTGTGSTEDLVRRYGTPGTRVLVYLAPVPQCRNGDQIAPDGYPDLHAQAPAHLPAPFFAGDVDYAHILPAYVRSSTTLFADWLAPQLGSQGGRQQRSGLASPIAHPAAPLR